MELSYLPWATSTLTVKWETKKFPLFKATNFGLCHKSQTCILTNTLKWWWQLFLGSKGLSSRGFVGSMHLSNFPREHGNLDSFIYNIWLLHFGNKFWFSTLYRPTKLVWGPDSSVSQAALKEKLFTRTTNITLGDNSDYIFRVRQVWATQHNPTNSHHP